MWKKILNVYSLKWMGAFGEHLMIQDSKLNKKFQIQKYWVRNGVSN